jgi:AcrR family transcriptional regulator
MMSKIMEGSQRAVADITRLNILNAAKSLFLEKGYDGASINSIAKLAGVNKTLIFHHYEDKASLWHFVKESIIESSLMHPKYDTTSARNYFISILNYRFDLYANNPELARLVAWQQVSNEHELLIGNDYASPNHWLADIKKLQKSGKISAEIDAKLIMLFIIYSSYAPFMQNVIPLNKKQKEAYKNIILESCITQFTNAHKK